jgi:hypothetical protein
MLHFLQLMGPGLFVTIIVTLLAMLYQRHHPKQPRQRDDDVLPDRLCSRCGKPNGEHSRRELDRCYPW